MNFSLDDRVRSLRRFLMETLGAPPWTVRVQREVVQDEERPVALVEPTSAIGPGALPARTSIPQGDVDQAQTVTISLYPSFVDDAGAPVSPAESARRAREVATLIERALFSGLVLDDGERWSYPFRVPVFDFEATPIEGRGRRGPTERYGWMSVDESPVRPIQDPVDPLRWAVVADLRCSWQQGGAIRDPSEPLVREFGGTFVPPPRSP